MKQLRLFLTCPAIFAAAWYFLSFQIAVIICLAYLYVLSLLLFYVTERQKDKLVELVEYIAKRDGLVDPKAMADPSTIKTADDAINAIMSVRKQTRIKQ